MAQILPEVPSFGTQLARGLGMGFGQGASQAFAKQLEISQRKKLLESIRNPKTTAEELAPKDSAARDEQFIGLLQNLENTTGQQLQPQDVDALWQQFNQMQDQQQGQQQQRKEDPFAEAEAFSLAGEPELSRIATKRGEMMERERIARGREEREREFLPQKEFIQHEAKSAGTYNDKLRTLSDDLPTTNFSIAMTEDSLASPEKFATLKDFLAEKTGYEGFRSMKGAELQSAIKNYFLGDLAKVKGGRPNILLEKNLLQAYPSVGYDPISNQKIVAGMKMKQQLDQLQLDTAEQVKERFMEKQGFLPGNIQDVVHKEMKSGADKIEKEAIKKMHDLNKVQKVRDKFFRAHLKPGEWLMMSPEGEPVAIKDAELDIARESGYIPLGQKAP